MNVEVAPICPEKMYYPKTQKFASAEQAYNGMIGMLIVAETEMEGYQTLLNKKTLNKTETKETKQKLHQAAKFIDKYDSLLQELHNTIHYEKCKMANLSRDLTA